MISMSGKKGDNSYEYVNFIAYDKFGNRKYIAYGNGTQTTYNYDPANLRLKNLQTTTAAGRLIQNNSYIYDAVGNILQLTNNADPVSEENLYGGVTSNNYSYDNRYQLITAEGSFIGNDKEHKYTMAMEYGATGKILRKTQSNQYRKNEGDWLTDATTSMDYRYSYNGQKPHAVSSIVDNNTETLFTYTYDASGNNLLETNNKASSDREIVWTEDNRLAAIKARGNVSHYVYDANGIRTLKMNSSGFNISINGVAAGTDGIDGNFTIYAHPYAVVRKNQCTKHFFSGSQRILTKISSSDVPQTFFEGYAENIVPNVDYQGKQDDLESNLLQNNKELNIGWYRETRGRIPSQHIKHYLRSKEYGGLSGVNPWQGGTESTDKTATYEEKQYYFHPDHLGSTNYLTDVTGEAYQHVAYLPWGEVFVEERNTQSSRNTFLYTGKELDEMTGLYYYEQRYMNPKFSIFLGVDQLTDKYPHISGFAYVANNPMILVDPDGRDLKVVQNSEGVYEVVGGKANDDLNIYIVDADNNVTGVLLKEMLTEYSFHNEEGEAIIGTIIDLNDKTGQRFFDNEIKDIGLLKYMGNAKGGEILDFKIRDMSKDLTNEAKDQYVYRGMSFEGKIASARDVGNYAAGYVAGKYGFSWGASRFAFDALETKQQKGFVSTLLYYPLNRVREGAPSQNAQYSGHKLGESIYIQKKHNRLWQNAINPYPIGPKW